MSTLRSQISIKAGYVTLCKTDFGIFMNIIRSLAGQESDNGLRFSCGPESYVNADQCSEGAYVSLWKCKINKSAIFMSVHVLELFFFFF